MIRRCGFLRRHTRLDSGSLRQTKKWVDLHSTYWHMTRWDHSTSKSAAKSSSKTTAKSPIHSRWEAQWWSRAGRTQQQQQGQQSDASLSSRACKQKRNSKLKLATCLLYFGVGAEKRATNPSCLITWGWSRRSPTKTPCSSSCGGKSCIVFLPCTLPRGGVYWVLHPWWSRNVLRDASPC